MRIVDSLFVIVVRRIRSDATCPVQSNTNTELIKTPS